MSIDRVQRQFAEGVGYIEKVADGLSEAQDIVREVPNLIDEAGSLVKRLGEILTAIGVRYSRRDHLRLHALADANFGANLIYQVLGDSESPASDAISRLLEELQDNIATARIGEFEHGPQSDDAVSMWHYVNSELASPDAFNREGFQEAELKAQMKLLDGLQNAKDVQGQIRNYPI